MAEPTITIMRPGTFPGSDGIPVTFSDADLDGVVNSYDPVRDPAPLVVGEPQMDDPAYGWVSRLQRSGDRIVATVKHLDAGLRDAVKSGGYPQVRVNLYRPDSGSNPKPGQWYLRHIGFSGLLKSPSAPPAPMTSFAAGDDDRGAVSVVAGPGALANIRGPGLPAVLKAPDGRQMVADAHEVCERIERLRAEHHGLPWHRAFDAACADIALETSPVAFAEGEERDYAVQIARAAKLRAINEHMSFAEAMRRVKPPKTGFAVPRGWGVTADNVVRLGRARAVMARNPGMGIVQAAMIAEKEGK
jgi:hypothetical protein